VLNGKPMYNGSLTSPIYSVLHLCIYVIFDWKLCVSYIELENRVKLTERGCHGDVPTAHGGDKNELVTSVAWKHGT
jgi:hypothetical protein